MPVTITPVGTSLNVSIIDENFKNIQDLVRSGVLTADLLGQFERYKIQRYVSGKVVSSHIGAKTPVLADNAVNAGTFDLTFRYKGNLTNYTTMVEGGNSAAYAMEMLGLPGPSMYFQWQEDELDEAVVLAGIAGWPPSYWPIDRYPKELCFSRWLTIPNAATRVWVDEPCIARITATTRCSLNMFRLLIRNVDPVTAGNQTLNSRKAHLGRFGIIVDTNPNLFTDEFPNTNLNIVNPITGVMAP